MEPLYSIFFLYFQAQENSKRVLFQGPEKAIPVHRPYIQKVEVYSYIKATTTQLSGQAVKLKGEVQW